MAASPLRPVLAALGAKLSPESDADLLARFVSHQDDAAFAALVRRYARLVWQVARARCRTDATAEDVFQATFVVLARKATSLRTPAALPGWLHRTAHRLAVKVARRDRPTAPLPSDNPVSADPLDALSARELLAAVGDEMAKLSDAERSVLVLCGVENQSLDEAANRLGCTVGAVKGRLERARVKLRNRLDARGLTLPAVALSLLGIPSKNTLQAATLAATGGVLRPPVAALLAHGVSMKGTITKAALGVVLLGALLTTGTFSGNATHSPTATAAPVPNEKGTAVVWSEPARVDCKASGAQRLAGVWTPDGKGVLVASPTVAEQDEKLDFGGVDFRDADTGKVTKRLAFKPTGKVDQMFLPQSIAVSPDGKSVYTSGSVFAPGGKGEVARGLVTWVDGRWKNLPQVTVFLDPTDSQVALSPDGKLLGTITNAETVEVQKADELQVNWRSKPGGGKRGRLTSLMFHSVERGLYVGTSTGDWLICDATTGKLVSTVGGLGMEVRASVEWADGKATAFAGKPLDGGQALVLLDGNESIKVADAVPEKVAINGVAFSPDGKHLAAACSDGVLRVYDVATRKVVANGKEHKEEVFSVAYSPDGKKLLTVGKDAIKVWDVEALLKSK